MTQRVAIVGMGRATRNIHLPALRKLTNVSIVGGYDAAGVADGLGVPAFASLDALLATRPDLLIVATPPGSHAELTRSGLLADCHVMTEKPFVETLADADALVALSAAQQRHVVVNSEFPYMSIHWEARRRMAEPGFGRLLFMALNQTFVVDAATEDGWRGQETQRTLKEFGTHALDLAHFFFGEAPVAFRARLPRPGGPGTPDYLNLIELEFSGDRVAHILLDRLVRGRHRYLDIRLDGSDATIETSFGGRAQATLGLRPATRRPFLDVDVAMGGNARLYRGDAYEKIATAPLDAFAAATARLIDLTLTAIIEGRAPPATASDARRTLRLLLGCYAAGPGETVACRDW